MQQWEYAWEVSPPRPRETLSDAEDAAMLQRRGAEGWELVSVVATPWAEPTLYIPRVFRLWYYFKRRKA